MPVQNCLRDVRSIALLAVVAAITLLSWSVAVQAETGEAEQLFGRISPEEAGFSVESLDAVAAYADSIGYAAIVLAYDGQVFFEWGDVSRNYMCHSVRKPLMSALYGIHVGRGEIDLDATIGELGSDDIPPKLTDDEKRATVRNLLESNSGVYHDAAAETPEMEAARPERGSHEPGEHFFYNNWGFNAAGTIFRQETGEDIFEAFEGEIAEPIGMQDFDPSTCEYLYERDESEHPSYAFRMSARDMARFGVLYQQRGEWEGHGVIPADWVAESTSMRIVGSEEMGVGYGYMWAVIREASPYAARIGAAGYLHSGNGGHVLAVFPKDELVVVIRVDTDKADSSWPSEMESLMLLVKILAAREAE